MKVWGGGKEKASQRFMEGREKASQRFMGGREKTHQSSSSSFSSSHFVSFKLISFLETFLHFSFATEVEGRRVFFSLKINT